MTNADTSKRNQVLARTDGIPVSGRWWKETGRKRFSLSKVKFNRTTWEKKMKDKAIRKDILEESKKIKEEKKQKKRELAERKRLNKIRTEENARKSEVVQVIKNPAKVKKMKRKQLRYIETRDTSKLT